MKATPRIRELFKIGLLILLLFILNKIFFGLQLNYGFRDVDWQMLYYYKIFGNLSFAHLFSAYKLMGAYTYELYYVGFLEKIFGLDFTLLHQVTQLFKVLTGLGIYFLVAAMFRNKLLALLSSIIYTVSYTHAGVMFMLSTGGYFFASIFMTFFLITYYYSLQTKNIFIWTISSFLLVLTLILNTERMYPLILCIILVELLLVSVNKFKKDILNISLKRTSIILLPIIIFSAIYMISSKANVTSEGFSPNQFFIGVDMRINSVLNGNWQLLLYPFASLGSMFMHGEYWKLLGVINVANFYSYSWSLLLGPVLKLGVLCFFILYFISRKPFRLTFIVSSSLFLFGIAIYIAFVNWKYLNPQVRIHFDPNLTTVPAILGFFILLLSAIAFSEWRKSKNEELLPLIIGSVFTVMFILLTWVASDLQLLFLGPQRYLSIPSMGTSLFISGLIVLIFNRLRQRKSTRSFAWIIFLLLVPLFLVNYSVIQEFFNYELNYAGMRGEEQTIMKNSFKDLTPNISKKDKSLFYFDETADKENGYFDESTVMAGFEFWTKFNRNGEIDEFPYPGMLRTNVQCLEHTHLSCIKMLKAGLTLQGGEEGVLYKDEIRGQSEPRFYKLSNFYAFRFINKKLIDVKEEVLNELEIKE